MTKNTKNDLKDFNLPPENKQTIIFVGSKGKEVKERDRHFAKSVESSYGYDSISHHYYLKVGMGELIDPYGTNSNISLANLNSMFTYRKVGKKTYDSFVKYLETQNRIYFTTARRLLLSEI